MFRLDSRLWTPPLSSTNNNKSNHIEGKVRVKKTGGGGGGGGGIK